MGQFDGKIAIVTGASRGIGRAIAERLASGGGVGQEFGCYHRVMEGLGHAGSVPGFGP